MSDCILNEIIIIMDD